MAHPCHCPCRRLGLPALDKAHLAGPHAVCPSARLLVRPSCHRAAHRDRCGHCLVSPGHRHPFPAWTHLAHSTASGRGAAAYGFALCRRRRRRRIRRRLPLVLPSCGGSPSMPPRRSPSAVPTFLAGGFPPRGTTRHRWRQRAFPQSWGSRRSEKSVRKGEAEAAVAWRGRCRTRCRDLELLDAVFSEVLLWLVLLQQRHHVLGELSWVG